MLPDVPCRFSLHDTGLLKSDNMIEKEEEKKQIRSCLYTFSVVG